MPRTMALFTKTIPVFERPDTGSRRIGRVRSGTRLPFVEEQKDLKDERTNWYRIEYEGKKSWVVERSHGHDYVDLVDGEAEEGVEEPSLDPPAISGRLIHWESFTALLPSYERQTYQLSPGSFPFEPKGLEGKLKSSVGSKVTNCTCFTVSLVPSAMDTALAWKWYEWWQVFASAKGSGYGPAAAVAAGFATEVPSPKKTAPKDGVYLVQDFSRWPKGHSYLVIDWDEKTGRMLTLEASSWTIDGVGFKGIGNLRDVGNPGGGWVGKARKDITWQQRRGDYPECHMARLHVDHSTVRHWLRQA